MIINAAQNRVVVEFLAKRSHRYVLANRSVLAMRIWALVLEHVDPKTYEITLSREEIAAAVDQTPNSVSNIMSDLVEFGVISRQRVLMPGKHGSRRVIYYVAIMAST